MTQTIKTKISKGFQTVVPSEVRSKLHGQPGDEIIWSIIGDEVFIRIKKAGSGDPLKDLIGSYATKTGDNATKNLDDIVSGDN